MKSVGIFLLSWFVMLGSAGRAQALDIVWMHVQHRQYGAEQGFRRLGLGLTDAAGRYLKDGGAVRQVALFGPQGKPLPLSKVSFAADVEVFGTYDAKNSQWRYTRIWQPESWFSANIASDLVPGVYVLKVTGLDGATAESTFVFKRRVTLPVIDAATFRIAPDGSGGLLWRWSVPDELGALSQAHKMRARAAVDIYRGAHAVAYFSVILPVHMGFVFVPRRVVEALNRKGDRFVFRVALETRDKNNRTYSRPVGIKGKLPPSGG